MTACPSSSGESMPPPPPPSRPRPRSLAATPPLTKARSPPPELHENATSSPFLNCNAMNRSLSSSTAAARALSSAAEPPPKRNSSSSLDIAGEASPPPPSGLSDVTPAACWAFSGAEAGPASRALLVTLIYFSTAFIGERHLMILDIRWGAARCWFYGRRGWEGVVGIMGSIQLAAT